MPDGDTLLQLLHISDLHFGDPASGDWSNARVPRLIWVHNKIEGFLGHHCDGLEDLHEFAMDLRERGGGYGLTVSGDLTVDGSPSQFDLAGDFLGGASPLSALGFGLGEVDWADWGVSGNHDQWPGWKPVNKWFGPPTPGLLATFPRAFPHFTPAHKLAAGVTIRFIFIDTDADVGHWGIDRFLARGAFVGQLETLRAMLPPRSEREVRVLVMHHSIVGDRQLTGDVAHAFPTQSGLFDPLEITTGSLRVLERFIVQHGVRVILTGHMHSALLTPLTATDDRSGLDILECRCGSTTQLDNFDYGNLRLMSQARELPPNTLVLHDLREEQGRIIWRARIHWRTNESGFRHLSTDAFSSRGVELEREIVVA